MIKQVWSLTREAKKNWGKIESVSYDYNGNIITPNSYPLNKNRPLVVFYAGENVYYLTCRSFKVNRSIKENEVLLKNINTNNYSLVETNNVHIMNKDEFFSIYDKNEISSLNDFTIDELKTLLTEIRENLDKGTLAIQKLTVDENWNIKHSKLTNKVEAFRFLTHMDILLNNILLGFTDEYFKKYIANWDDEQWLIDYHDGYLSYRTIENWSLNECKEYLEIRDFEKRTVNTNEHRLYWFSPWDYENEQAKYKKKLEKQLQKEKEQNKNKEDDLALSM